MDYFAALESERVEARIVRERFPDELKGKVLGTVQFREYFSFSKSCVGCLGRLHRAVGGSSGRGIRWEDDRVRAENRC